jgi:hypothetical protein
MPIAIPRWLKGNASVRMAVLFAKRKPAPTACTSLKMMSSRAAVLPEPGVKKSSRLPTVKIAKPRLYILTRPNISEMRPNVTSKE